MRVLMTTTGYAGHFLPMLPFAHVCSSAGHDVCVAAPGSRGAAIARTGLWFWPCADPPDEELARLVGALSRLERREGHALMMSEGFADVAARAILGDVLEIVAEWRPDVIVHESQEYAGPLAAERLGIPHVRVALGLSAQEEETLSIAGATVNELRAELGLADDPDAVALRESPYLTLIPAPLEEPGAPGQPVTHRFRDTRRRTTRVLPQRELWHESDDPLVYLTFGSVAGLLGLFPRVYQAAIEPLAALRARILLTIGDDADPGELGPLPENVRVRRWVSQEDVLPHAAAVVCHGGYGSVLGALAHGVPLVLLPIFSDDQWRNARRVAEVGAGVAIDGDRGQGRRMLDGPGPEAFAALPEAIVRVLSEPEHRGGARRIARAIDELPSADAATGVLEAIATLPDRH